MEVKNRTAGTLVKRLSHAGDEAAISDAIAEIRLLSKHDAEIRFPLAESGVVALLSGHLLAGATISSPSSQENASAALLNLSITVRQPLVSSPELLDSLARCLRPAASAAVSQNAAATVFSLLADESCRPIIGSNKPLLSALISVVRSPASAVRTVKDAIKALFGVALYPPNRPAMVQLGAVPALFSIAMRRGQPGLVEDATAVIARVAGCCDSLDAFRRVAGIRVLMDLMNGGTGSSGRTRENAVAALLNLANAGGEEAAAEVRETEEAEAAVSEAARAGISVKATRNAEALLKILASRRRHLESYWIRDFELLSPANPPLPDSSADSTS
ncbi:U-box domain-containing protein 4 [Apostasia shenzhenica]|uniref:U-box domain-containing protein 4 n=1 Tax=Apostasia shenzhenica TaxID=1088818 RepID=A0A2I0ADV0_9ASPA|nr:U-box domain-containing protein 4 [Apostasia shenzhenica]